MEGIITKQEQLKSVSEGGLEAGIEKMRDKVLSFTSMIDQIERLQKVPSGYSNLGDKVGQNEQPALDQFVEYRGDYEAKLAKTEAALSETYQALLSQLGLLRKMTGINTEEEAMKFDKNTGRQEKDK